MFYDLVKETRTVRHFDKERAVDEAELSYLIECARLTPSAANLQRIRYVTVSGEAAEEVFGNVAFAGYLPKDKKPTASVSPTAYILMLTEEETPDINLSIDIGISAQTIALAARERGIGACMIRSFGKEYFKEIIGDIPYTTALVIALGYPIEQARIVDSAYGNIKYYKDEDDVNCVPKRSLEEIYIKKITQ